MAGGPLCNECARGYTGTFPKCVQCHPCFQHWDDIVCQVQHDLETIHYRINRILETGTVPGVSDTRIRALEKKLAEVQDLLNDGDRDRIYHLISQSIDDLRYCS